MASGHETGETYYVADVDEIGEAERVITEIRGREIAVFNVDGEFYALANYCTHQGGPACEGVISGALALEDGELTYTRENQVVSCPWHGWEFDIATGEHLAPTDHKIPSYDVVIRDGKVYVIR